METARRPGSSFDCVLDGVTENNREKKWFRVFMPALRTFRSLFGHTDVPEGFVVPRSSPLWPPATWGLHLGQIISRSHDTKRLYSSQVAMSQPELNDLGFTWTTTNEADRSWKHQVLPALYTFHQEQGHCNVPATFVVPEWESWPKEAWGLNLGAIVKRIRAGRSYADQSARDSDKLTSLGFLWDPKDVEWQERILPALATFADEFGHRPIAPDFVVPSHFPWLKQTWGLELGAFLSDSRKREQYSVQIVRDSNVLENLGFEVRLSDETWQQQSILPALDTFSFVFGHCSVPDDFIVPSESPWPTRTFGLALGKIVWEMENYGTYFAEVGLNADRLETLGFRYQLADSVWLEQVTPLLKMYATKNPHEVLPEEFVVPPKEPWPKELYGLKLGKIVS
eukprot:jgi/Phyca11/550750/estExt2_Genewise1Plus.C_PHYCAscaffold_380240